MISSMIGLLYRKEVIVCILAWNKHINEKVQNLV